MVHIQNPLQAESVIKNRLEFSLPASLEKIAQIVIWQVFELGRKVAVVQSKTTGCHGINKKAFSARLCGLLRQPFRVGALHGIRINVRKLEIDKERLVGN